jgi:Uncharacterized protein conserved in bacteria
MPDAFGGLVATHELTGLGFGRGMIAAAVRRGAIRRVRQGWYSHPRLTPDLVRAARVGGVATCSTALRLHGVWVAPDHRLHVAVAPDACQLRCPDDARRRLRGGEALVHWTHDRTGSRLLRDPMGSLLDFATCAPPVLVAASAESLLHEQPHRRAEWLRVRALFPERMAAVLSLVDGTSESGTEFVFFARLGRLRARVRRQVPIPGVGRVDVLLGERLVVEIDGRAYHSDPIRFEGDRRRDAALSTLGYRVLRFSHRQVLESWPEVEAAVWAALARGDHY